MSDYPESVGKFGRVMGEYEQELSSARYMRDMAMASAERIFLDAVQEIANRRGLAQAQLAYDITIDALHQVYKETDNAD